MTEEQKQALILEMAVEIGAMGLREYFDTLPVARRNQILETAAKVYDKVVPLVEAETRRRLAILLKSRMEDITFDGPGGNKIIDSAIKRSSFQDVARQEGIGEV